MCCEADFIETKKFLSKHRNHKTVTVYKILGYNTYEERAYSPYQYANYNPGIMLASKSQKLIYRDMSVYEGIHVWLDEKTAEVHAKGRGAFVVRMKANITDLVAVGYFTGYEGLNAVFNKVKFSQREYDRLVIQAKRRHKKMMQPK